MMLNCEIRQREMLAARRYLRSRDEEKRDRRWTYITCALGIAMIILDILWRG